MFKLPYSKRKSSAFTLIELLVVITILGILATVAITSFRSSQMRSRDAKRKSDLKQIANALEMFYSDRGFYPSASSGKIVGCPYRATSSITCQWGATDYSSDFKDGDNDVLYFKSLPKDPAGYTYYYVTNGQSFQIFAHLENDKDQNCINSDCSATGVPAANSCGGSCNFAITSANVTPKDSL
jgi:type II secretion system protein G